MQINRKSPQSKVSTFAFYTCHAAFAPLVDRADRPRYLKPLIGRKTQMTSHHRALMTLILSLILTTNVAHASGCSTAKTQVDLNECAVQELHREASQLDDAYNSYLSRLTLDNQQTRFAATQSAWRKYVDLACDFEASAALGGSAQQWVLASCLISMTKERRQIIEGLLRCPEGALNCPKFYGTKE